MTFTQRESDPGLQKSKFTAPAFWLISKMYCPPAVAASVLIAMRSARGSSPLPS
jgi:hypothetical protein